MKKLFLAVFLFLSTTCFAQSNQTESLTISTYYPSPYGVYRDLEIHRSIKMRPVDLTSVTSPINGTLAVNQTDNSLWIYNTNAGWQVIGGGGSAGPLVGSAHTEKDCTKLGGVVIPNPYNSGLPICQFNNPVWNGCPPSWIPFNNWSATKPTSVCVDNGCQSGGCYYGCGTWCHATAPSTGCSIISGHNWGDTARESCSWKSVIYTESMPFYVCQPEVLYAIYTSIGCW